MNSGLSLKEMHLINVIGQESHNQRKLAETTGLSLGMTNILLKKLATKGYVKVVHLNGRTLRYMLTPRGFKEKVKRTHDYLQESIRRIRQFRQALVEILNHELGHVGLVWVYGDGEVMELACEILDEVSVAYSLVDRPYLMGLAENPFKSDDKVLLLCCMSDGIEAELQGFAKQVKLLDVASLM